VGGVRLGGVKGEPEWVGELNIFGATTLRGKDERVRGGGGRGRRRAVVDLDVLKGVATAILQQLVGGGGKLRLLRLLPLLGGGDAGRGVSGCRDVTVDRGAAAAGREDRVLLATHSVPLVVCHLISKEVPLSSTAMMLHGCVSKLVAETVAHAKSPVEKDMDGVVRGSGGELRGRESGGVLRGREYVLVQSACCAVQYPGGYHGRERVTPGQRARPRTT